MDARVVGDEYGWQCGVVTGDHKITEVTTYSSTLRYWISSGLQMKRAKQITSGINVQGARGIWGQWSGRDRVD